MATSFDFVVIQVVTGNRYDNENLGIRLDLTEIDMILRENVWFNENWDDFTSKGMI